MLAQNPSARPRRFLFSVALAGLLAACAEAEAPEPPPLEIPVAEVIQRDQPIAIEMVGLCIKHLILAVRLLANMVAGHLVLLGIMGMITAAATYSLGMWATVTGISVVSSALFSLLELFVAFLQAYLFTFLSALFIGAAVHQH